jgi:hypothetical protein
MMNMLLSAMSNIRPVFEGRGIAVQSTSALSTSALSTSAHSLGLQSVDVLSSDSSDSEATFARYHSLLAMEAARKMRRTRQKRKTGQEVCHHLKMMLAEPAPERETRTESQFQLGF